VVLMKTHPLRQWSLTEATDAQFRLVDLFQRAFNGFEALQAGDYGAPQDLARARATAKVERVLAEFFGAEDAVLVPGAGTGAIRNALMASLSPGARVVVHDAPVYATTGVTFRAMGIDAVPRDFNDRRQLDDGLGTKPAMVYVQHSWQRLDDRYDLAEVIDRVRQVLSQSIVLVDDNYTAFQVPRIGTQLGANLSGFSLFKVLGEPGVGCVLGDARLVGRIRDDNYSGGTKIQGPIAVSSLKGLVYAPVALAVQAHAVDEIVARLNDGEVAEVARAWVGNHQERGALVEFRQSIAGQVADCAWRWGAAPYPVGSQSKYETSVMVYRLSRAMCEENPERAQRMLRVNPFRVGPDTVLRVLAEAVAAVRRQLDDVLEGAGR
jgi:hypothetical protein